MSGQDWQLKIRIGNYPDPHAAPHIILAISHNLIHGSVQPWTRKESLTLILA